MPIATRRAIMDQDKRYRRRNKISGQFSAYLIKMLESPAYRVLSLSARRVINRIEIELAHHGGCDNGRLPVTYADFESYGIDRHAIAPAVREAEALGFIVVTERGRAGNAEYRSPNLFRLTFRQTKGLLGDGTHEWRKIGTIEEAAQIAAAARKAPPKKQKPSDGKHQVSVVKNTTEVPKPQCGNPALQATPEKSPLLSIFRGRGTEIDMATSLTGRDDRDAPSSVSIKIVKPC
jgi:hypothetical protein